MAPRRRKSKAATTEISALDSYLLMLILLRLPVKLLHRLKCVSKRWNILITSAFPPQRLGTNSGFLGFDHRGGFGGYFPRSHDQLLLPPRSASLEHAVRFQDPDFPKRLTSLRPTTRPLVPMPEDPHGTNSNFIALEFDPTMSLRYKIIRSLHTCCNPSERVVASTQVQQQLVRMPFLELEIFSSETQKWVRKNVLHGPHGTCLPGHVLLLNGSMYKLVHPNYVVGFAFDDDDRRRNLVPLDVNKQTSVSVLPVDDNFSGTGCLSTWGGWLHYTSCDGVLVKIWRVSDFGNSAWEVIHVNSMAIMRGIVCRDITRTVIGGDVVFSLAGYSPDFKLLFLDKEGRVMGYDYPTRTMHKLSNLMPWTREHKGYKLQPFWPSLFNPRKIPEALAYTPYVIY
ncbi:hypothetical protein H6P81_018973 [Aristolochia fimbriata]|uniref:F-box domain-containing protein n=1 Tax=Aristolochia fimbriata TaxID=158543 RepID=A0AAV7E2S1_ARIFI|nr:hypothetical protein H6P81_018973 [Aristolochia fimbriata]